MPDATKTPASATNDATRDTTARQVTRQSVALSDAARRLGVSLRTVQRRVESGALPSEQRDGRRFVLLETDAPEAAPSDATRHDKTRDSDATGATNDATPDDLLSRYVARLEGEVDFLRRALESAQQSEAVTKASLREALRAMPRALSAGTAIDNEPQKDGGRQSEADRQNGARIEPQRDDAAVTLDSIADWLERENNR